MEKIIEGIKSLSNPTSMVIAAVVILLLLLFCKWLLRVLKMSPKGVDYSLEQIDVMKGSQFEEFVAAVLEGNGYKIEEITITSGDYGADIIAIAGDERIAVQCKRYNRPVGVKAVQEVIAAMKHYNCESAIVVTNNTFTKQAIILAQDNEVVELWDRQMLVGMRNQAVKK
ncbi:MAG: restriction endonuclease [Clostridiales bacterium]|nr:restriction endonuclease [Clostridiales bacterium]